MGAIRKYVAFSFVTSLAISAIVVEYVPFLRTIGFSLSEVALLGLAYNVLIACIEVPTGMYADKYGCKSAVTWSQLIYIAGILVFAMAMRRGQIMAGVALTAISFAMQSGARQSWLMSQLTTEVSPSAARRAFADATLAAQGGAILAPMFSAWVKSQWAVNCFYVSAFCSFVALIMLAFWPPDTPTARPHQSWIALFHQGRQAAMQYPILRWLGWMSLFFALVSVITNLWSPALRESRWHMDGYWVWFAMQAGLMVGSVAYRSLPNHHAPLAMVISFAIGGTCLVMASRSPDMWWLVMLVVLQMSRSFFQVARDHAVQASVPAEVRATASSWISLASQVGMMVVLGFTSIASQGHATALGAIYVTWLPAGALLMFASTVFYLRYRKIRPSW